MERTLTIRDRAGHARKARLLTANDFTAIGDLDVKTWPEAKAVMDQLLSRALGCTAEQVAADFEDLGAGLLLVDTSLGMIRGQRGSLDDLKRETI